MKKVLFTAGTMAVMALASCSNDETQNINPENRDEITFDVTTNSLSRSVYNLHFGDLKSGFYVSAVMHQDNSHYFDNELINYTTDGFTWATGTRMWPQDGSLDFYAIHSEKTVTTTVADGTGSTTEEGVVDNLGVTITPGNTYPAETGTVTIAGSNNPDILYAATLQASKGNKVALNFRHALALLSFGFTCNVSTLYVEICDIDICNINTTGTYKFGDAVTTTRDGTVGIGTWTPTTTTGSVGWGITDDTKYTPVIKDHSSISTETLQAYDSRSSIPQNYVFVMPQSYAKGTLGTDKSWSGVYAKIKCRIYNIIDQTKFYAKLKEICGATTDTYTLSADKYAALHTYIADDNVATPIVGTRDANGEVAQYVCVPLPTTDTGGWECGKYYKYTFTISNTGGGESYTESGDPALVTIEPTFTVDSWPAGDKINTPTNYVTTTSTLN